MAGTLQSARVASSGGSVRGSAVDGAAGRAARGIRTPPPGAGDTMTVPPWPPGHCDGWTTGWWVTVGWPPGHRDGARITGWWVTVGWPAGHGDGGGVTTG